MRGMSRPALPSIVVALNVVLAFLAAAQYPYYRSEGGRVILLVLLLLNIAARTRGRRFFERLDGAIRQRKLLVNLLVLVASLIVTLGAFETVGQVLVRTGVVEPYNAMQTMVLPGTGATDYRMAHITADKFRVPDPVLLWRPIDRWPYNRQRLKGPLPRIPKPPGTFRIVCYGDSNTDGPNEKGWTEVLHELLGTRFAASGVDFEVLNAGVAGYSSYQGLMRFRHQVEDLQPDLVTVSFGYNDIAPALGVPDRKFRLPPRFLVSAQRQLLRYRFYRVAEKIVRRWAPEQPPAIGPRVPLADYLANLESFLDTGARQGAGVVLMTRPHSMPAAELAQVDHNWRGEIPLYNRNLLELGQRLDVPTIDVQGYFERHHPHAFYDDCHFTLDGHARMAEMLLEEFLAAGLLPVPTPELADRL
ncbi:MAG: SGNH/GDSL hydrolase family protein [Acidobacteriota bacterium]